MGLDSATIPNELTGPTPRNLSITVWGALSTVVAAVALSLCVAGAVWFGNRAMQTIQQTAALHSSGVMATGEVVETWREGKAHALHASYTFRTNGTSITGKAEIPKNLESAFNAYSVISIRYLPSDPAINHPAAWDESASAAWFAEIFPLMPGVLGTWLLFMLRAEKKLLVEGTPVIATVTECTRGRNGFFTRYEFQTADGQGADGSYTFGSRQETGSTLCILYLPQKVGSNEPYLQLDSHRIVD